MCSLYHCHASLFSALSLTHICLHLFSHWQRTIAPSFKGKGWVGFQVLSMWPLWVRGSVTSTFSVGQWNPVLVAERPESGTGVRDTCAASLQGRETSLWCRPRDQVEKDGKGCPSYPLVQVHLINSRSYFPCKTYVGELDAERERKGLQRAGARLRLK